MRVPRTKEEDSSRPFAAITELSFSALLHDAERLADLAQDFGGAFQIGAFVGSRDDGAQTRFAFRDRGIADGRRVKTRVKQLRGEFKCFGSVAHVNGNDGRLAPFEAEALLLEQPPEIFRVGPEFLDELFAIRRIEQRKGRLAGGRDRRRMSWGEKERPSAQVQIVNQIARAADVSSHGADGLAERADLNVYAAVAAGMVHRAAPTAPENAGGMGVVHHHDAIVFFRQVAELRQRRDVAVHGEDAIGDQQLVAGEIFRLFASALAIGDVFVLENLDGGLGQAAAVNDGGVIQLVGNNQVLFAENGGDGARVGGETGLKHYAGLGV